jgi:hypothetical protein
MPTPPSRGAVSSPYGMRINPNDGIYRMHYGEDTLGDGNYAPVTGTVVFAAYDHTGTGLGYAVGIRESANPSVIWWVAHHASLNVHVGQSVTEAVTKLGVKGSSGAAQGVHCHTERRVGGAPLPGLGTPTNPRSYYTTTAGDDPTPFPPEPQSRRVPQMIIFFSYRSGVGEYLVYATATRVSLSAELSAAPSGVRPAAIQFALTLAKVSGLDYATESDIPRVDDTPNGGWFLRNQIAYVVAGMPSTFPLSQSSPYSAPGGSGGLTSEQDAALMGLPAAVSDLPTNGELGQALTSTVALVNEHADGNKAEIIAAIPQGGSGGASPYSLSIDIDSVPGTATGTATPA